MSAWLRGLLLACTVVLLVACERRVPRRSVPSALEPPLAPAPQVLSEPAVRGDSARGHALVERFECNRCHEGTGLPAAPLSKNCFSCHEQILTGRFPVSVAALARFRPHVASAREAPSLTAIGARVDESWIVRYLLAPRDLRPRLTPSMPRLAIEPMDAADIAAYLMASTSSGVAFEAAPPGNAKRGRELIEQKGCSSCHAFSGVPSFTLSEPSPADGDLARAAALAPDLRFTRERFRPDHLLGWLLNPKAIKPDTRMPNFGLARDQAADIVAYLLEAPLSPEAVPVFERLPPLSRRISFAEVNRQVFSRTCHHCHTDAESAGGDGGPGNTGGFGFAPRGVSFSSHASILAGYVDAQGKRHSLFEPLADGTPRLVAALLARHDEARFSARDAVRGMPLGLPPLSAEDIQLVESWVAQGKPL